MKWKCSWLTHRERNSQQMLKNRNIKSFRFPNLETTSLAIIIYIDSFYFSMQIQSNVKNYEMFVNIIIHLFGRLVGRLVLSVVCMRQCQDECKCNRDRLWKSWRGHNLKYRNCHAVIVCMSLLLLCGKWCVMCLWWVWLKFRTMWFSRKF